ncbi:YfjI family protein [Rhodobacter capsulatus]|uniref:DUF3987 domain-containing protein n=1 Tax=Rhodobacter capsulatus TaxID=1061 RepID=A0A1G7LY40_RHOCA|nr:YfjI family protein [Rhodobacter capsulatus]WER10570.1 YfjI family protein [Rhodobacter capsulatus]SDF54316.1 Protein of unknown function [Rhodobacter capsulatus]
MSLPPLPPAVAFDPKADWPEPDLSLLNPVRPPPPVLSDAHFDWIFGPWASWLRTAAAAKGAPLDYVALGLLTTASALIGNARWPLPFEGWDDPPILWGMLVGDPSAGKSPALDAVMAPLREIEHALAEAFKTARAEWESRDEIAALMAAEWKKDAKKAVAEGKLPPPKPANADAGSPPIRQRLRVSDATTEKMAELLSQTSRGLLMYRDELSGWLGGMDRYSNGGDRPFWLEAYGGRSFTVDRKSAPDPIIVDRLSVAVIGGTQPDRLNSLLVQGDDDGLLARFLVVFPDPVPISLPSNAIDTAKLRDAFNRLRSLAPGLDANGKDCPVKVGFDEAALTRFQAFRVTCREWEEHADGCFKSHLGKLSGQVARVSCVLAHLDWAANPFATAPSRIDAGVTERAAYLVGDHLRLHAFRAYGAMQDAPEIRSARRLARLIVGETLSVVNMREIQRRKLADLGKAEQIQAALGVLVEADWLRRETEPTTGRPKTFWIVNPRLGDAPRRVKSHPPPGFDTGTKGDKTASLPPLSPFVEVSKGGVSLPSIPGLPQPQQKE